MIIFPSEKTTTYFPNICVVQVVAPESIQELYSSVSKSKSRQYFLVVAMTCVGVIFVLGLFCGRVSRRTLLMKNK